jgi:hypothetical protein
MSSIFSGHYYGLGAILKVFPAKVSIKSLYIDALPEHYFYIIGLRPDQTLILEVPLSELQLLTPQP